jgi:hypothetical protein
MHELDQCGLCNTITLSFVPGVLDQIFLCQAVALALGFG